MTRTHIESARCAEEDTLVDQRAVQRDSVSTVLLLPQGFRLGLSSKQLE